MTAWSIVGALVFISAVTVTILSVVRLDGHFRDEQHGYPTEEEDSEGGPGSHVSPHR